ncbi:MAG: hydrogenase maturation nickel metallochaperone HypA [Nitrospirota bacterium]
MHEASLAFSVLDVITGRCVAEGYKAVRAVRVRIGRASGVMPEALIFAFDAAKADTTAGNSELLVDIIRLGGHCNECLGDFEVDGNYLLECPLCGSGSFKIERGYEMEIVDMEVD